jgi:hypothetical protein
VTASAVHVHVYEAGRQDEILERDGMGGGRIDPGRDPSDAMIFDQDVGRCEAAFGEENACAAK